MTLFMFTIMKNNALAFFIQKFIFILNFSLLYDESDSFFNKNCLDTNFSFCNFNELCRAQ